MADDLNYLEAWQTLNALEARIEKLERIAERDDTALVNRAIRDASSAAAKLRARFDLDPRPLTLEAALRCERLAAFADVATDPSVVWHEFLDR